MSNVASARSRPTVGRLGLVLVGTGTLAAAATWCFWSTMSGAWATWQADTPPVPADLLLGIFAACGQAVVTWLAFGVVVSALSLRQRGEGTAGARAAHAVAPAVVRRVVATLLGVGLSTGVGAAAAFADGVGPAGPSVSVPGTSPGSPGGEPTSTEQPDHSATWTVLTPARPATDTASVTAPATATAPASATAPATATATARATAAATVPRDRIDGPVRHVGAAVADEDAPVVTSSAPDPGFAPTRAPVDLGPLARPTRHTTAEAVTVRAGDTLWAIAERHLGASADSAQIAAEWPRWYAANRALIGEDPDVIDVGQRLVPPGTRDQR